MLLRPGTAALRQLLKSSFDFSTFAPQSVFEEFSISRVGRITLAISGFLSRNRRQEDTSSTLPRRATGR